MTKTQELKKASKTTRSVRYDLNQIPYDYTVVVMNSFKRLNLQTEYLKNYGQVCNILQEAVNKTIPKKKKCKKAKKLSEEALQVAEERSK